MGKALAGLAAMQRVFADSADGGGAEGNPMFTLLLYLGFFAVVMVIMVYLPQRRKDKKAKEMLASLKVGYTVTTHSGIVGRIMNIKDDVITIQSGVERTQIEFKKWAIKDVDKQIEA